jgi:mevalonate kinase
VIGLGKIILLGEHAVVHGHAALAGAIDRGVRLRSRSDEGLRLCIPDWQIDVARGDDHPVARALGAIAEELGVDGVALDGESDLPPAAGLGSSAALSVAITRALAAHRAIVLDLDRTIAVAGAGERQFHGNPSGVDVALAARGGIGLYRRGAGLSPLDAAPVPVVVGLSGEGRATATMVARVAEHLAAEPDTTRARLERLGELAGVGAAIVSSAAPDLARLGTMLDEAHGALAALGLSTPALEDLCGSARAAGALGAKLTGAGGGGAVVALAPGREDAVLDAWRARGKAGFACRVGAKEIS